uniref:Nucleotide modification associated domain 1 n=1 Tax=Siphoviridae sp. ctYBm1 TaxID=2826374 RepID=A0A8S5LSF8_9CAUD|nr:MAG TPA: Nucleotide modification associated domain 1 [Siphoviridae sp. ctYBm1]
MTKVNQQTMKTQYDGQYDTFCRKNHDYGNSFEESLDQFGIVASIVRMSDKMKRLASLTDESKTQQVGSESLLDTLEDLSNYAAMTACWLKGVREEYGENTIYADNKPVISVKSLNEVVELLKKALEFNYKIEWARMSEDDCVELKKVINRLSTMVTDGSISEELMVRLIKHHVKFNPEATIHRVFNQIKESQKNPNEDMDNKPVVIYKEDTSKYEADVTIGNDWELTDAVRDVVTMLKVVFKLHCKIEEFRMTKEDYEELDHITNRLRSMVNDGTISEELMRKLIDIHVKLNPDVVLFQLFNYRTNISSRPTDEQEAKRVALFNVEILNMAKDCLNELFDNIILCRDQNIPLPKRLTYCSYREEKYEQIAALVLTGNIDFGEVSSIVNDYPNLRVAEKNHLLQSIVSAAYKISDEPDNEKPEFLNKKFNIPDEILEDLKEPEEEPERKRTVLGMIFPFRL